MCIRRLSCSYPLRRSCGCLQHSLVYTALDDEIEIILAGMRVRGNNEGAVRFWEGKYESGNKKRVGGWVKLKP